MRKIMVGCQEKLTLPTPLFSPQKNLSLAEVSPNGPDIHANVKQSPVKQSQVLCTTTQRQLDMLSFELTLTEEQNFGNQKSAGRTGRTAWRKDDQKKLGRDKGVKKWREEIHTGCSGRGMESGVSSKAKEHHNVLANSYGQMLNIAPSPTPFLCDEIPNLPLLIIPGHSLKLLVELFVPDPIQWYHVEQEGISSSLPPPPDFSPTSMHTTTPPMM
ncbi:hypothetical protein GH733_013732 [Mirounga leonina]|nr:hypothetical protein GH733_013732 [Mirounga leonina]